MLSRSGLIFLVLTGCLAPALAQFPIPTGRDEELARPAQIRELVSKFCRLEYEGARLDPQGWSRFEPVVWWKTNPEYAQMDVVSRFTVDEPTEDHGKYEVMVHYRLIGGYDLNAGYAPEPGAVQNVEYTVTYENAAWKIASAENTSPHVSKAAMLKWLNSKLASSEDANAKVLFQAAVQKLQAPATAAPQR